jgi:hypothetical protein
MIPPLNPIIFTHRMHVVKRPRLTGDSSGIFLLPLPLLVMCFSWCDGLALAHLDASCSEFRKCASNAILCRSLLEDAVTLASSGFPFTLSSFVRSPFEALTEMSRCLSAARLTYQSQHRGAGGSCTGERCREIAYRRKCGSIQLTPAPESSSAQQSDQLSSINRHSFNTSIRVAPASDQHPACH